MRSLVAIVFSLLITRSAAADVAVSPVQLRLSPVATSGLLKLNNNGSQSLRFQVSAKAWAQSPTGEMELTPTNDIAFYPAIFELPPNATKRVRVGALVRIARGERNYRVFIEQLPRFDGQALGVQVLTRLSIPIFMGDEASVAKPVIVDQRVEAGALKFAVNNAGESHFRIKKVRLSGRDASGAEAFSTSEAGWYVLGRGQRVYSIPLEQCERLASAEVVVDTDVSVARALVPLSASDCDP